MYARACVCASECCMTTDLWSLGPVAVIHAGCWRKEREGGHYGSICQHCTVLSLSLSLSVSLSLIPSSQRFSPCHHLSFSASQIFPHSNSLFSSHFTFLPLYSFFLISFFKPCSPSVNQSPRLYLSFSGSRFPPHISSSTPLIVSQTPVLSVC